MRSLSGSVVKASRLRVVPRLRSARGVTRRTRPRSAIDALAERGEDRALDDGVRLKPIARHQELVQLLQSVEGDAWVPMMLDVIADVARQDEECFKPGRHRGT